MRIVICDYAGHPFQVELSRSLAHRGHPVLHLHFADLQAPKGELTVLASDSPNFHAGGIRTGVGFDKGRFLRRWFLEARVGQLMAARAIEFAPDVVVGCNMPLDAQKKLRSACAARASPSYSGSRTWFPRPHTISSAKDLACLAELSGNGTYGSKRRC